MLGTLKYFRFLLMMSFHEDTSPIFLSHVLEKEGLVCYLGSIVAAFKLLHRKLHRDSFPPSSIGTMRVAAFPPFLSFLKGGGVFPSLHHQKPSPSGVCL